MATTSMCIMRAAAGSGGVLSVDELHALGASRNLIHRMARDGRLTRLQPRVYGVGYGPFSEQQRWLAAAKSVGPGGAVSHVTACRLLGVWTRRWATFDVTSTRRFDGHLDGGARFHRPRGLRECDVVEVDGLRVTDPYRTLFDLSGRCSKFLVANVMNEMRFVAGLDVARLARDAARLGGRRGAPTLRDAVALHLSGSAGTRSMLEDDFIALVAASAWPEPIVTTPGVAGIPFECDCVWPGEGLVVELDGRGHGRPNNRLRDMEQDRTLRAMGFRPVRLTSHDVYRRWGRTRSMLDAMLQK